MSSMSWIVEGLLIVLLGACLFYCWRLERKLTQLRKGEDGLRDAARELSESVTQAQAAILSLRATAHEAGRDLQGRIDLARGLTGESSVSAPIAPRPPLASQLNITRARIATGRSE
jgi:hypothetical protein